VSAEINNKNKKNYTIGLKKRDFFNKLTDDFRDMVAQVVRDEINTSRRILPVHFDSSVVIEKNLGLIVYAFANVQQSEGGPPSSDMSWSKLFCVKMIELASKYAFVQENSQVPRTALKETSDFIEAILKQKENQNVPQSFSALLPKGIDPKQFRVIWEELLTEQNGMNSVIMGLMDSLQNSKRDMLSFVSEDFLPELVDFISGAVTVAANNVALNKVLPELKTSELARKFVVQHLSAQGDGDDNKIFLLKSLLGVPKEKEAKESLRKQILDPLAVDKVVDYFVANFASGLDKLQKSGRNISESQIAGIRKQIDLSIKGVHKELQQQAADKAQEVALRAQKKEFADLQKQTYAALDALIQGALPKYLNNQQVKWPNLKLSEADRNKLLFFRSEKRSSDTLHNDLLDLIVVSLVASPDFTRIIEGKNPVVQQNFTGKNITYCRATDEQKQLFVREFLQTIPADTLAAALENCAKLPETFTAYIHQREMSNLAQAIQELYKNVLE
ncbi:MAG: hypothetical protein ACK53X_06150, partial [Holosporales bacterium]